MRKGLLSVAVTMTVLASPAVAHAARFGDSVLVPIPFPVFEVQSVSADATHRPAFVDRDWVVHQDDRGRWHRFWIGAHDQIEFVRDARGGYAIYDAGTVVTARRWERDGRVGAPQPVLTDIGRAAISRNRIYPWWTVATDDDGTIVVAGPTVAGGVRAAIRPPGGGFAPQQDVLGSDPAPQFPYHSDFLLHLRVSPIAEDGSVTIHWSSGGDGIRAGGKVTRIGRAGTFSAPEPAPQPATNPSEMRLPQSRTVRVAADVAALCGQACFGDVLAEWPGRRAVLAFWRSDGESRRRYVATRGADGAFTRPSRAPDTGPLSWSPAPGVLDTWTVREQALYRVPLGGASRRSPSVLVSAVGGAFGVEAGCDVTCRLRAAVRVPGGSWRSATSEVRQPLDPFEQGAFSAPLPARAGVAHVDITARATNGRQRRSFAVLRTDGGGRWLLGSMSTRGATPAVTRGGLSAAARLPLTSTRVLDASSGAGRATVLVLADRRIAVEGTDGEWRRFIATDAVDIDLVQLEDGGGMAVWGAGTTVYARSWTRQGRLAPAVAVLTGVHVDDERWKVAADRAGNVVVAATGDDTRPGALLAAIRAPGGAFTTPQLLQPGTAGANRLSLSTTRMGPGGAVTISWIDFSAGTSGSATRAAGAPAFGPAVATRPPSEVSGLEVDGPEALTRGPDLTSVCQRYICSDAKLFSWPGGEQLVAVPQDDGRWYVARRQANGTFDQPRLATRLGGVPTWTPRPGVLAFVKAMPSGAVHAVEDRPARRAARVTVGKVDSAFRVPVTCDATCSVGVAVRGGGRAAAQKVEPMETAILAPPAPRTDRVRVTVTARGAGGTRRTHLELRRVRGQWRVASGR